MIGTNKSTSVHRWWALGLTCCGVLMAAGCSNPSGFTVEEGIFTTLPVSTSQPPVVTVGSSSTTGVQTTTSPLETTTSLFETTTTTISIEQATALWELIITNAAFTNTSTWRSGAGIYGIAHSDDSGMPAADGSGFILYGFDGSTWQPLQVIPYDNCTLAPQSCEVEIVGAESALPVIFAAWCCPMGSPAWSGPVGSAWRVVDGRIEPAMGGNENFYFGYPVDRDTWFDQTCGRVWMLGTPNEACVEFVRSEFTVQQDGSVETTVLKTAQDESFEVCIVSIPDECLMSSTIRFDERCRIDPEYVSEFSLEPCEYGSWVEIAERALIELGFPMVNDGYYDPGEEPSVIAFQREYGLDTDGFIGPATWTAMLPQTKCNPNRQIGICGDTNNDGVYGPGDIIENV